MSARYIGRTRLRKYINLAAFFPNIVNHIHNPTISSPLESIPPSTKDAGATLDPALGFFVAVAVAGPLADVTLAGVSATVVLVAAVGKAATAGPPQ